MDIAAVAMGAVKLIGPFLPFLTSLGQSLGQRMQEEIQKQGGQVVWNTAQQIWNQITGKLGSDQKVQAAASMLAADPEDADSQDMLAKVLAARLQNDAALKDELLRLLGGEQRLQEMLVGDEGRIERVRQQMAGPGVQRMQAGRGGVISDAVQDQG